MRQDIPLTAFIVDVVKYVLDEVLVVAVVFEVEFETRQTVRVDHRIRHSIRCSSRPPVLLPLGDIALNASTFSWRVKPETLSKSS